MYLIQAFVLWSFVAGLVIGGALVFHSLFPRENRWFGFIVPSLAFVLLGNFVEHFVALPSLLPLAPVLAGLISWQLLKPTPGRRELLLPSAVFLGAFAFTFAIRCLQPDIGYHSDGLADLNKINNYCQGGTIPPVDTWLPPYKYVWYYSLQHYAASLLKRLFLLKIGVAYNIAHALLSALICVAGAAAADRLSGGKRWIILAVPFLIESAATGSSAYLFLTMKDPSPWLANNPSGGFDDLLHNNPTNPIWNFLAAPHHERLELQVPGFWSWRDEYHANASGHLLTLFAVFVIFELTVGPAAIWPWIMALLIPLVAIVASSWALPLTGLLCGGGLVIAWAQQRRPSAWASTVWITLGALLLIWPVLSEVTSSPEIPPILWTELAARAPLRLFLFQWWPVLLLWIFGCCLARTLPLVLGWILIVLPLVLITIEFFSIEGRYNTVEKMWGYSYGIGLIALFPIVAARKDIPCRLLTFVLLLSSALSFCSWLRMANDWMPWGRWHDSVLALEGNHYLTADEQKRRLLQVLTRFRGKTFLTGRCVSFNYYESAALSVFTENKSFATWTYFESVANYREVAEAREKQNLLFYSNATPNDRLHFLRSEQIDGAVIWPGDAISDAQLGAMTQELAPAYRYIDCRGWGDRNAGVFLLNSLP